MAHNFHKTGKGARGTYSLCPLGSSRHHKSWTVPSWDIIHSLKPLINDDWDILGCENAIELPLELNGKTCYMVAPGFSGRMHYGKIPKDAFIIVVNYAIKISELNPTIWLCGDEYLMRCDWFLNEMARIEQAAYPIGVSDIKAGSPVIPVFDGKNSLCRHYPYVRSIYSAGYSMNHNLIDPIPGVLRVGLTISCQAVQLAYWLGAKRIILCGLDMYGRKYFDSSDSKVSARKDRPWPQVPRFNKLLSWLSRIGADVVSLSETALQVEVLDHAD